MKTSETVKKVRSVLGAGKKIDGYDLFNDYYLDYWYPGCTPEYGYPQEYFDIAYKGEGWYCLAKGMSRMEGPFRTSIEALAAIIENCPSMEMIIVSSPEGNNVYFKTKGEQK